MGMNQEQTNHLANIQLNFIKEHRAKFEKGAAEHKTELHKDFNALELLAFCKEEVLDLVSYIYTLEEILNAHIKTCEEANGIPVCKNCGLGQ